jgi:RecA-family ATPase
MSFARPALPVRRFVDLAAAVDGRGPRRWLVRGVWPAGDYGVLGGEPKAQKTWNADDLAVSVASGTPWLGAVPVETSGPVIVFAGEGGDGNVVRRIRAIATGRGIQPESLPLWICSRAPHLTDEAHLAELAHVIAEVRPVLVVLDPLYLAAGGANGADLYAMGKLLERPQHLCQAVGAALLVVTHYNRSRDLKGAARFTGAGPAEWGRVLIAAEIVSRVNL